MLPMAFSLKPILSMPLITAFNSLPGLTCRTCMLIPALSNFHRGTVSSHLASSIGFLEDMTLREKTYNETNFP